MHILDTLFKQPYNYLKKNIINNPFDFKTRSSRSEFLYTHVSLFYSIALLSSAITLCSIIIEFNNQKGVISYTLLIFLAITIIPICALYARRINDTGKSPIAILLLSIISMTAAFVFLIIYINIHDSFWLNLSTLKFCRLYSMLPIPYLCDLCTTQTLSK